MSQELHKADAPTRTKIGWLTVSDTRTPETDTAGIWAQSALREAGHDLFWYQVVADEPATIVACIQQKIAADRPDAVIVSGGTGISRRDMTVDALEQIFAKRLVGFGELFRMLSFQEIGPAAMLSRATAGVVENTIVFCLPGSSAAVRLGLSQLILPELGHLARELRK